MHAAPVEGAEELFGTETMAELCVRQGRLGDALAIYRRLVARGGEDARRERWSARLSSLEAQDGEKTEPPAALAAQASQASQASAAETPVAAAEVAPAAAPRASLVVREPVRSGQVVYAQDTDLIVLAPVNAGAQLMADGHIHVYAALRGRAVAGVRGDRDARIFCQRLEAELVGVDAAYLTAEDIPAELLGRPAQVWLDEGRCRVKAL